MRKVLTLKERINILYKLVAGKSVAKEFGVGKTQVQNISTDKMLTFCLGDKKEGYGV